MGGGEGEKNSDPVSWAVAAKLSPLAPVADNGDVHSRSESGQERPLSALSSSGRSRRSGLAPASGQAGFEAVAAAVVHPQLLTDHRRQRRQQTAGMQ